MPTLDVIELCIRKVRRLDVPFEFCYGVEQAAPFFLHAIGGRNVEVVALLCLADNFRAIGYAEVSVGNSAESSADIPQILRMLLLTNATRAIVAHNHPSGVCVPSDADIALTRKISTALCMLGFSLVDSLIVTTDKVCSLREEVATHGHH